MVHNISVIVPCFNEEKRITNLLDAICAQTYPAQLMDITIADGASTDHTRDVIAQYQLNHPDMRLQIINNPSGTIPSGLNLAIQASEAEILLRLDAHSAPYPDYVEKSVAALLAGKGQNVGGVWEIHPGAETWIARSIARAAAHPLGVGDALYRHARLAAIVDTVPFGCFTRDLVKQIGGFDETLLANEDYEFNTRIRQSGGTVWLDPAIRSIYYARSDFFSLARQYFRYGFWKFKMLRRYPRTIRWRQALPPIFTFSLLIGLFFSFFSTIVVWLLLLELLGYFTIMGLASLRIALKEKDFPLIAGLPLAIAFMHIAWGSGFLWSIFSETWKS